MMMNVSIPVLQRLQYVVPTASRHGGEGVNDAAGFGSGNQCLSFGGVGVVVQSFLHFFFACSGCYWGVLKLICTKLAVCLWDIYEVETH
jgi:hypothetical protein